MSNVNDSPQASSKRFLVLLPVLILLPGILAYVLASAQQEKFEAHAEVTHTIVNPSFGTTDRLLATQEVKAQSRALAEAVSQRLGIDINDFIADLNVDPILTGIDEDSTAIEIRFRHAEAAMAGDAVQAYVDEYLASEAVVVEIPGLEGTTNEIERLQERRNELLAQIGEARDSGDLDIAEELNGNYESVVTDLGVQVALFNNLRPNTPVVVSEQLGSAWVDNDPVEPQPIRAMALGLVAGICIASAVLLLARRPRTI